MADPLSRPGGHWLWSQKQRVESGQLNSVGTIANQALFNLFAWRLFGGRDGVMGDDLLVTDAGGGVLEVAPGVALMHDTSATDEHGLDYRPIVLAVPETIVLDEADATNDRIDVISIAPADVDGVAQSVWVRDGTTLSPSEEDTRRAFGATVTVTKGTAAATPSAPATPSGHMKLAEVRVAGSTGAFTITDFRPPLTVGAHLRPVPGESYVVEGLEPSLSSSAVVTTAGVAEIDGTRVRLQAGGPLTAVTNSTGATRYDLIVAKLDGTVALVEGDGTTPEVDDAAAGTVALGYATVDTTSAITAVTDLRETGTIGAGDLRAGAVGTEAIADEAVTAAKIPDEGITTAKIDEDGRTISVKLTAQSVGAGNPRPIDVELVDADGNPVSRQVVLYCRIFDPTTASPLHTLAETGAGTVLMPSGGQEILIRTSTSGTAQITVTPNASLVSVTLIATPHGSNVCGGYVTYTT